MERAFGTVRDFCFGMPGCALCGAAMKGKEYPLGLCRSCFESVPWIREVRCETCGRAIECSDCRRRPVTYFQQNRSAVQYDETMKEWLALWKYRGDERLANLLAGMLLQPYNQYWNAGVRFDVISYVPVSETRFRERGFNQAEELATGLGRRTRLKVMPTLDRVVHTDKQSFKTRQQRLADLTTAFAVRKDASWIAGLRADKPVRIVLVDDVFTTGSTLNQCARILRSAGDVEVYGLSWAR